ncbi:MAG TPA: methyl-accepting chemotaxis protein [Geobacteraceae bacterium]|nr:methyl-accepting chemotaxis protein [Geobacteraceae bacterium]
MLKKYLSSLKSTYIFMVSFGLMMGVIFPFYSAIFFGTRAFNPLYVAGCLTAGLLVGLFSFFCIKVALRSYLERQMESLSRLTVSNDCAATLHAGGDELQGLLNCNEQLTGRVLEMVANLTAMTARIDPLYQRLAADARAMTFANNEQVEKSRAALQAVIGVKESFRQMQSDIEQVAGRSDMQVSISAQMSSTIDSIAKYMREYTDSVIETSASIEEVVATVRETGNNIEDLAASTEQTVSSILEISMAISMVRDHAARTAACSEDVQQRANEGLEAMAATIAMMQKVEQSSELSFASISKLSVHTEQVGKIIGVIRDVVEQTNLLSLNASIIAAQAGERGKSFAVVAEEVRGLARRTAQSAGQIEELVANIQAETASVHRAVSLGKDQVKEGVKVAIFTNDALNQIGVSVAEVLEMVRKIVTATKEQANGSQLISGEAEKNLARVKQVTRAVQEEKRTTGQIMVTLQRMRDLSDRISSAIEEQVRGNLAFINGVKEDNRMIRTLQETAVSQGEVAEGVVVFVRDTGALIEANADRASGICDEIEAIARLTARLNEEIGTFRKQDK